MSKKSSVCEPTGYEILKSKIKLFFDVFCFVHELKASNASDLEDQVWDQYLKKVTAFLQR